MWLVKLRQPHLLWYNDCLSTNTCIVKRIVYLTFHISGNLDILLILKHIIDNILFKHTRGQPRLSAIVQAQRLSLFGHIARMPDESDARSIITASPPEDWRRPPGRPRTTWMKTIQQDLRSNDLSLDDAITVAQNRPLWRLMSAFGATHP